MSDRTIVWFRRDLRLTDHPALAEACADGEVLPLFVVDPAFAAGSPTRWAFLHDCLEALDAATGGALVIRHGDPVDELPAIAAEVGATSVVVSRDYTPYGRQRDGVVGDALRASDVPFRGCRIAVRRCAGWRHQGRRLALRRVHTRSRGVGAYAGGRHRSAPRPTRTGSISRARGCRRGLRSRFRCRPPASREAHDRWVEFRADALDAYDEARNLPAVDGTSRLSPYLRFGVLHPRQLLADTESSVQGHATFESELAWRDFYADVLFQRPETAWENLDRRFDALAVDTDAAARARFECWCEGRTGFPIVDAGMRQLVASGWMHNRVRMVVASFLVKDLHLPWQWGARFFMRHLLDGDLASNNHGWQWAAGTGTDAAPFFRVFNPTAQQERWDPDGEYVRAVGARARHGRIPRADGRPRCRASRGARPLRGREAPLSSVVA